MRTTNPELVQLLDSFEEAVRNQETYIKDVQTTGESDLDYNEVSKNYEETKAELLVCLSYVP